MTARQVFEATLIELSKIQAPSLKLYEFNYLFNKAINQYINKVYNVYDINQQTTDDLRVLKATTFLTPTKVNKDNNPYRNFVKGSSGIDNGLGEDHKPEEGYKDSESPYIDKHKSIQSLRGATYEVYLPLDYLHMLNCVCIYYVAKQKDCWDKDTYIEIPAVRLTADSWSQIITDIYNRPSPMRPYYYIHNDNQFPTVPTNPITVSAGASEKFGNGTDMKDQYSVTSYDQDEGSNFNRTFKLTSSGTQADEKAISLVEKPIAVRVGNASNVRCEIRYGKKLNKNQLFLSIA